MKAEGEKQGQKEDQRAAAERIRAQVAEMRAKLVDYSDRQARPEE